jgi:hypothetical protein
VSIVETDLATVVEIFERVNSTGTKLGRVDFMRAVTWSEEFDLEPQLAAIAENARDRGFDIPDETLIKLLGLGAGREPTAESLVGLRKMSAEKLLKARDSAMTALDRALGFFRGENVFGYDYVPYEGQLIVVVGFFIANPAPTERQLQALSLWYRSVALAEFLRGKPDHYVSRALELFQGTERPITSSPAVRFDLRPDDLIFRRFTVGKALSAGIATLFASQPPHDIISGEEIPPAEFMRHFEPSHFESIVTRQRLDSEFNRTFFTSRVIANMVVVSDASRARIRNDAIGALRAAEADVLASQLISSKALSHLHEDDVAGFIKQRSMDAHSAILNFIGQSGIY